MGIKRVIRKAKSFPVRLAKKTVKKALKKSNEIRMFRWYRAQERIAEATLRDMPQKPLTAEQKSEIDRYWAQFGFRVRNYAWFQWYYGSTGKPDPRNIPSEYYFYAILPYYNNAAFISAYKDKNAFDTFLSPDCFPKTVMKRINGDFYGPDGAFLSTTDRDPAIAALLGRNTSVIVKNVLDSGQGKNVKKYTFDSAEDVEKMLQDWSPIRNYLVQEVVRQHPFFAQFNESSVNIMRINTWYRNGEVIVSTPVVRFGMPGYATDVCHINGEEIVRLVGLTDDGFLRDEVVHMNGKRWPLTEIVPDPIRQVPAWDRVLQTVRENAKKLKHFRLLGWDITVDENEQPVVIEYNITRPSPYSSQMTDGPMWGDHTEELLAFLKDDKNRERYIQKAYRLK